MSPLLILVLIILLCGGFTFPAWNYNRAWGYGPFGGLLGLLILLLVLHLLGVF